MQSSNPVFARSEGFNGRRTSQSGVTYPGYDQPSAYGTGAPQGQETYAPARPSGPMTIDTVVQKTAFTLGLTILVAAATWVLTGDPANQAEASRLMMLWMFGAFAGLGLSLVISFKKSISPGLVLAFAVVEGIFVGAMSKYFEALWPGIVMNAVLGTLAAAAGTLAAYKFFNIQVSDKFRKFTIAAMFSFVGLALLSFVLRLFGMSDLGLFGFGGVGLVMSLIGLVIGVFMLILDFDFVERGVAAGLPEAESWRAAFGLTVTLVWIYINMLRVLAILRGD
ncbi:MAG TPA: Bax inhibitor-1/YccA family protein [Nocardioidaceae bacterium]|jgi:uncharacterized YccA/Bax inhibitor family protein|nr:Bax inhibitor-1/YccA family protein [Nocardioidaceae bacterium]